MHSTITELEALLLKDILKDSEFNGDSLDLTLSWEEQRLEREDLFQNLSEVEKRAKRLGLPVNTIKGVLGSLQKKRFISIEPDENLKRVQWIFINEEMFNRINDELDV